SMNLLDWLLSWFRPRPIVRDVSGMSSDAVGSDAATRHEAVATEGGPLKPENRRRALRDPRLLPQTKPTPAAPVWPRKKKERILSGDEANRLFSATMRTRDRAIRDLLADPEQLDHYALPRWQNEADVAAAMSLTLKQLRHYSIHRIREQTPHYVT